MSEGRRGLQAGMAIVLGLLTMIAALAPPRPVVAASGLVQVIGTNFRSAPNTNTISITVPASGVTAGHSIIVTASIKGFYNDNTSCSDDAGNTYTVDTVIDVGTHYSVICAAHNVSALSSGEAITITHDTLTSPDVTRAAIALEFSGLQGASPGDAGGAAGSSGTNASAGSGNTSQADELIVGAIGVNGPDAEAFTVGTNNTANQCTNTGSPTPQLAARIGTGLATTTENVTMTAMVCVVAATGNYTARGTLGTAHAWTAQILTYRLIVFREHRNAVEHSERHGDEHGDLHAPGEADHAWVLPSQTTH
jgi:hypothetical protein